VYILSGSLEKHVVVLIATLLLVSITVYVNSQTVQEVCPSPCKLDIAFALDVSGSMDGQPLEELKNATTLFINMTCPDCKWSIGLVAFNDTAYNLTYIGSPSNGTLFPVCSEEDKTALRNIIYTLNAGGWTNIGDAIYNATAMILNSDRSDAGNILVIVTDGLPNRPSYVPDPEEYAREAADYAKSLGIVIVGIYVGDASGDGDEFLLSISSSPQHFINASIQSNINMTEAFLLLFNRLCELSEVKVGGEVEMFAISNGVDEYLYAVLGSVTVIGLVLLFYMKKHVYK